jgi:hypothetical protein
MCPRRRHLFDEAASLESHFLHCDACGLMVHMRGVEVTYVKGQPGVLVARS